MKTILINGDIGWSVTAADIQTQLDEAGGDPVCVKINSDGGDVFEGIAIVNALRGYAGEKTVVIESRAISAASFIAVGIGAHVVIRPNAEIMIHKAWTMPMGNSDELQKTVENLDRQDQKLAEIYAAKAGGAIDEWLDRMAAETWYSAAEALDAGLVDEIRDAADAAEEPEETKVSARMMAARRYASRKDAPPPKTIARNEYKKENTMSVLNQLANELGISPDQARNALLKIKNEEMVVTTTTTVEITYPEDSTVVPTGKVTISPTGDIPEGVLFTLSETPAGWTTEIDETTGVVTATAPNGAEPGTEETVGVTATSGEQTVDFTITITVKSASGDDDESTTPDPAPTPSEQQVTLDKGTYDDLRAAAQFGWKAMQEEKKAKLVSEVDTWIKDGRIAAAHRDKAVKAMLTNPEIARDLYGSNPKNTIPTVEIGSGKNPFDTADDSKASDLRAKADRVKFLTNRHFH